MKHNCPRCKKEFALSAKLAGKQLRVRCTSCGTVFRMRLPGAPSVSAPAAPPAAPAPKVSAPAAPPPRPADPRHKYFAVIGGKRLGPMPFAALKRLVGEEKITGNTLLWRKGLGEWLPAAQVADVASLFPGAAPPPLRPPVLKPPPLKPAALDKDVTEAAAQAAQRAVSEARLATDPVELTGKVTGDVFTKSLNVQPDEEPTDQEVNLDDVDNAFFAVGEKTAGVSRPGRAMEAIEVSDGPMFPVEMEAQHVDKGARASLKDFSVMVTLSRRSRRKGVFALVALAVAAATAIVIIFTLGDPLGWKGAKRTEVEWHQEGHRGLLADRPQNEKKKLEEAPGGQPDQITNEQDAGEDPEELIRKMEQKEWKVSLDEDEMAVDREKLASKLGSKKQNSNGSKKNSGSKKTHSREGKKVKHEDDDGEMSLEEFANSHALSKDETGSAIKSGTGGSKAVEAKTVGKGMDSAMGSGLGGSRTLKERKVVASVKERAGDGSALKALVGRRVSRKVGAERNRIKSCMDRFSGSYSGPGGQLKASLHFTDKGAVSKVSIKGGGADLEECFTDIFAGWHISTINRKIKIPIAVRFK